MTYPTYRAGPFGPAKKMYIELILQKLKFSMRNRKLKIFMRNLKEMKAGLSLPLTMKLLKQIQK